VPLLIAETLYSNLGGAATLIGDPPNIIVGSAFSSEVSFLDFLGNMLPGVALMFTPMLFFLRWQQVHHLHSVHCFLCITG
jgi:Na+/H+ antiporter NhaD/arsenite permease-like protein